MKSVGESVLMCALMGTEQWQEQRQGGDAYERAGALWFRVGAVNSIDKRLLPKQCEGT